MKDKVIDSRLGKGGTSIRRRRECLSCQHRYTTYESMERAELTVIKKDGTVEFFRREKILKGLAKACEKRPVPVEALDQAVTEIEAQLRMEHEHADEVTVQEIGYKVMDALHQLDPVAYIRYVSVYREFDNVQEFIEEIQSLTPATPPKPKATK